MEFPEGRGWGLFWGPILENPEGGRGHRKNPFRGGVWIFSGTTHCNNIDYFSDQLLPCSFRDDTNHFKYFVKLSALHNRNPRECNNFVFPQCRLSNEQMAFYVWGPREWNGLADNINNTKEIDGFKWTRFDNNYCFFNHFEYFVFN